MQPQARLLRETLNAEDGVVLFGDQRQGAIVEGVTARIISDAMDSRTVCVCESTARRKPSATSAQNARIYKQTSLPHPSTARIDYHSCAKAQGSSPRYPQQWTF
jgi:hypothetical protein